MKKLLEWQKIVLWLANHDSWHRPYELEKNFVEGQIIGSEADTRLGEMFGELKDRDEVKVTVENAEYTVQTKKEAGGRYYRAFKSKEAPKRKSYFIRDPLTNELKEVY